MRNMKHALKRLVRNQLRSKGWDVVRGPNLNQFLDSRNTDIVIDVGANVGDYGDQLRRWGYRGAIVSIEPASGPYAALNQRINGDPAWQSLKVAAGSETGEAQINLSDDSRFNSILALTDLAENFDPHSRVVGTETVPVETLDNLLRNKPFSRGFLKIDTQGFEKQCLEGAKETLARCEGVQLELPVGHLYGGVWSFREALDYMDGLGFVLAQNVPTNTFSHDRASVIEFDCVFRRKDERDHHASLVTVPIDAA